MEKNGAKEKHRSDFWLDELPSYTWFGRIIFFLMWKHRSLLELARAHLRFNTEFNRTLSNFDFQWTKILYQKN